MRRRSLFPESAGAAGHRRSIARGLIVPALIAIACGTTIVTIRVDIASFLSPEELLLQYGDSPTIPGNGPEISVQSAAETIPLPNEIQTVTQVDAIEIRAVLDFRNESGSPTIAYRIYLHESADGIFDTPPVVEERVELTPGAEVSDEIVIDGDDRLLRLFEKSEIAVASEIDVSPGGGPDNVVGEVEITELTVQVTAAGEN